MLCKDARQMHAAVDPGCNESVQQMCEHPNFGSVLVATEVTALWRRSGDRRALRTLELLAMELRTKDSGLSDGRKLGELSAGDLPQPDLWTADDAHLWFGRYTAKWRCQCGCRMLADSRGTYSIRFR